MKKTFSILLILISSLPLMAQQDPVFSQSMFNQMAINPAYAGSNDMICATAMNRTQWTGFVDGTPVVTSVNVNAPIKPFGLSSGIGLNILNDQFGFNKDLGISLSYAVRFKVSGGGTLAVGLNGGVINNSLDPTWNFPDASTDIAIPQGKENAINFDMGAGIFYNNEDMFFGFSATHLNKTPYYKEYNTHYKQHFYLTGGYLLKMRNPAWQFNPSVLISSDLVTNHLTITANVIYNKRFWGGVSYRAGEAVIGMVGFELFSGLRVGYSYDFSTTAVRRYNYGSHELMVGYCFSINKEKAPQQYKSVRFL